MAKLPLDKMAAQLEDIAKDITGDYERRKVYPWDRIADATTTIAEAVGAEVPDKKYSTKKAQVADTINAIADADVSGGGGSGGDFAGLVDGTITQAYDSTVTSIRPSAFVGLSNLTEVSFPECKTIGYGAFSGCSQLSKISFPECTTIYTGAFNRCIIREAIFPTCVSLGSMAVNCETLEKAFFPALPALESSTFAYLSHLNTVVLQNCSFIDVDCFLSCVSLESLYMLGSSQATLSGTGTYYEPFGNTKIPTTGHIYVPASLMDSYKSASYWTKYSSRFEGLTDEEIAEILGE